MVTDIFSSKFDRLYEPHIAPLNRYVDELRRDAPNQDFPYFDPDDGGIDAKYLFLFEKPGPKASKENGGSGFISRDNPDNTARATKEFMNEAGISRKDVVLWNVIPGWDGQIKYRAADIRDGITKLEPIISKMKNRRNIVLVGKAAGRALPFVRGLGFSNPILSPHPSPIVKAFSPDAWKSIPSFWAQVHRENEAS